MNIWIVIWLITLVVSITFFVKSVRKNRLNESLDQIGPWVFGICISISVGSLLAGIFLHKIPGGWFGSKIVFIIVTSAMTALMSHFVSTSDSNEVALIQDPLFGMKDPVTGIKKINLVEAGRLFARLPGTIKLPQAESLRLQKQAIPIMDVELEPSGGPATLTGKMAGTWENDMAQQGAYSRVKKTEVERIKYVNDILGQKALEKAGAIAKTSFTGDQIMKETKRFGEEVLLALHDEATRIGVKITSIIFSKVDWDPVYKKVLGDIALANKLVEVALKLSGLKKFTNTPIGREIRWRWLEEAKVATGIGDIKKEIFDVRGLGHLSEADQARIAGEIFAGRRTGGAK